MCQKAIHYASEFHFFGRLVDLVIMQNQYSSNVVQQWIKKEPNVYEFFIMNKWIKFSDRTKK